VKKLTVSGWHSTALTPTKLYKCLVQSTWKMIKPFHLCMYLYTSELRWHAQCYNVVCFSTVVSPSCQKKIIHTSINMLSRTINDGVKPINIFHRCFLRSCNIDTVAVNLGSAQIFQNCRRHLTLLSNIRVTCSKFDNEDPKILGATIKIYSPQRSW
jgi:hypothetical protein